MVVIAVAGLRRRPAGPNQSGHIRRCPCRSGSRRGESATYSRFGAGRRSCGDRSAGRRRSRRPWLSAAPAADHAADPAGVISAHGQRATSYTIRADPARLRALKQLHEPASSRLCRSSRSGQCPELLLTVLRLTPVENATGRRPCSDSTPPVQLHTTAPSAARRTQSRTRTTPAGPGRQAKHGNPCPSGRLKPPTHQSEEPVNPSNVGHRARGGGCRDWTGASGRACWSRRPVRPGSGGRVCSSRRPVCPGSRGRGSRHPTGLGTAALRVGEGYSSNWVGNAPRCRVMPLRRRPFLTRRK